MLYSYVHTYTANDKENILFEQKYAPELKVERTHTHTQRMQLAYAVVFVRTATYKSSIYFIVGYHYFPFNYLFRLLNRR